MLWWNEFKTAWRRRGCRTSRGTSDVHKTLAASSAKHNKDRVFPKNNLSWKLWVSVYCCTTESVLTHSILIRCSNGSAAHRKAPQGVLKTAHKKFFLFNTPLPAPEDVHVLLACRESPASQKDCRHSAPRLFGSASGECDRSVSFWKIHHHTSLTAAQMCRRHLLGYIQKLKDWMLIPSRLYRPLRTACRRRLCSVFILPRRWGFRMALPILHLQRQ